MEKKEEAIQFYKNNIVKVGLKESTNDIRQIEQQYNTEQSPKTVDTKTEEKPKTETPLPDIEWQVKECDSKKIPSQKPFTLKCTSDLPNDCIVQWDLNGKQLTGKEVKVTPGLLAGQYTVTCTIKRKRNNQDRKSLSLTINVINEGL